MLETITFLGHEYGLDGIMLIAEKYDDGIELAIAPVTNNLNQELRASFIRRGPRGGITFAYGGSFTRDEMTELELRMVDARLHLDRVESWRKTYNWDATVG